MSAATGASSNKSCKNGNPKRQPERQFRGTLAPAHLHNLVESQAISARAAWLVMVIDSLSGGDDGCFASNAFLATKMGVKIRQLQNLLVELEKAKLLQSAFIGSERHLWIDWGQATEEGRGKRYTKKGRTKQRTAPAETEDPRHAKNCMSDMQKIAYIQQYPNGYCKNTLSPAKPGDRECVQTPLAGEAAKATAKQPIPGFGLGTAPATPEEQFDRRMATRLYEHLKAGRKTTRFYKQPPGIKWAVEFAHLRQMGYSRQEIEQTLGGYLQFLDAEYMPQAYCAQTFREKFVSIQKQIARCRESCGEADAPADELVRVKLANGNYTYKRASQLAREGGA